MDVGETVWGKMQTTTAVHVITDNLGSETPTMIGLSDTSNMKEKGANSFLYGVGL